MDDDANATEVIYGEGHEGITDMNDDESAVDGLSYAEKCRTVSITFDIWKLKYPPGRPVEVKGRNNNAKNGKKKNSNVRVPKNLQPKWVNFAPRYPIKRVMNMTCDDWLEFRRLVFEAIDDVHEGILPMLKAAYRDRTLAIEGWINGSDDHKKTDRAVIDNDNTFKEFTEVALAMPLNVKMGVKLLQPSNPKDDEDSNVHLYSFFTEDGRTANGISESSEGSDDCDERSVWFFPTCFFVFVLP